MWQVWFVISWRLWLRLWSSSPEVIPASCVTLGKALSPSEPCLYISEMEIMVLPILQGCKWGLSGTRADVGT